MSELTLLAGESSLDGSLDPHLGIVSLRVKCSAPNVLAAITGTCPEIIKGLVENQPRRYSRHEGGDNAGYIVEITLEGHLDPDNAKGEEYSLEGSLAEQSIDSHPNYAVLRDRYGGVPNLPQGPTTWPATLPFGNRRSGGFNGLGESFAVPLNTVEVGGSNGNGGDNATRNPMHGVQIYMQPGLIWTRRTARRDFPQSLVDELGSITMHPPGNPPAITGRRQWQKIRASGQWRGNVWLITESWELVGGNLIAPELYEFR